MSATVMRYAGQWVALVPMLRDRISSVHADVKVGIGLNFNRLDDTTSVAKTYSSSRASWLMWQLGVEPTQADTPPVDAADLRKLLAEQLDFVSEPGIRLLGGVDSCTPGSFRGHSGRVSCELDRHRQHPHQRHFPFGHHNRCMCNVTCCCSKPVAALLVTCRMNDS